MTVDLQAGTVTGDASVGSDTVSGISQVRGSNFDDSISGSGANETLDGRAGNDLLDGRGGFDQAIYNSDGLVTGGIVVDMAAGTVTGNATVGNDTLRSIEFGHRDELRGYLRCDRLQQREHERRQQRNLQHVPGRRRQ